MNLSTRLFMCFGLALAVLGSGACEKHRFEDTKILHGGHGSDDGHHGDEEETSSEEGASDEPQATEGEDTPGVAREVGL